MARAKKLLNFFKDVWALKAIIVPIAAVLIPLQLAVNEDSTKASRCGYTVIVMAVLWLTEAIPIPVTSLIPIFLLPLLGVSSAREVSGSYVTDTSMLFMGGLIVAVAVEEWGLHKRIALAILRIVGAQPNLLMLGLMLPTWFLSMWISNTAAASMMVPIISAVTSQMKETGLDEDSDRVRRDSSKKLLYKESESDVSEQKYEKNISLQPVPPLNTGDKKQDVSENGPPDVTFQLPEDNEDDAGSDPPPSDPAPSQHHSRLCKALALSIAYAANTGGIATLTGSPPNLVLKDNADRLFDTKGKEFDGVGRSSGVTFGNWMIFALPLSFIVMILGWLWLQIFVLRCKKACACCQKQQTTRDAAVKELIRKEYQAMGSITFAEYVIGFMFLLLASLWIFREPPNIAGWGSSFPRKTVSDSTPAIFIAVMLFLLPAKIPNVFCRRKKASPSEKRYQPILEWKQTMCKLPWGVILLLGGGFALAKASKSSGLSASVGNSMNVFSDYEPWVMNLVISSLTAAATEVTSNTATATLLMPILAELADVAHVHPLYLMISAAVACSFAFMLPVATPPSAIVFSNGFLTIPDMASAGLMMNVICVLVLTLAINTWGMAVYNLGVIPEIFLTNTANTTTATVIGQFMNQTT